MSSLDNLNENKSLDGGAVESTGRGEGCGLEDETIPDYLARTGRSTVREVSIFAGVKKPRRRKPTYTFPHLPSLF